MAQVRSYPQDIVAFRHPFYHQCLTRNLHPLWLQSSLPKTKRANTGTVLARLLSTDTALSYAQMAEDSGDWAVAYDLYRNVLDSFPTNRRAKAGAENAKPRALQGLLETAQHAQTEKRWETSEELIALAFRIAPEVTQIGIALAHLQLQMGEPGKALGTAQKILKTSPNHARASALKAQALSEVEQKTYGEFLHSPAHQTDEQKQQSIPELHRKLTRLDADDPAGVKLHLKLFTAYEDQGDFDTAFTHLSKANQTISKTLPYDFTLDALHFALTKNMFHSPLPQPEILYGTRPIFVTGLTSTCVDLVADLIRQSQSEPTYCATLGSEEHILPLLQSIATGNRGSLTQDDLQVLRHKMLKELASNTKNQLVMVDATALNFRWIGYICAALPEARVLHVNHEPMEAGWSLYRQGYRGPAHTFAHSLESIANYMLLHQNWMENWRETCAGYLMEIDYAALIKTPVATTQNIADFLGLEWNKEWLPPLHDHNDRTRRGWTNYATHLEPLRQALKSGGLN